MTSTCAILLCSAIFCHFTLGYDHHVQNGKLGFSKLETKKEENHVLNGIVKRAIGDTNQVGGNNDNDNNNEGSITTEDTNAVEYVAPAEEDVNNNISMKSMVTDTSDGGVTTATYINESVTDTVSSGNSQSNDLVNNTSASNANNVVTDTSGHEVTTSTNPKISSATPPLISNETNSQNGENVNQSDNTTKATVNGNTIDNPNEIGSMTNATTPNGVMLSSTQPSVSKTSDSAASDNNTTTPGSSEYNTVSSSKHINNTEPSQNTSENINSENVTAPSNNIPETATKESLVESVTTPSGEHPTNVTDKHGVNSTSVVTEVPGIHGNRSTTKTPSFTNKGTSELKPNTTSVQVAVTTSIPSVNSSASIVSATNNTTNRSGVTENVVITSVIPVPTSLPSGIVNKTTSEINQPNVTVPTHSVTPSTDANNPGGQNNTTSHMTSKHAITNSTDTVAPSSNDNNQGGQNNTTGKDTSTTSATNVTDTISEPTVIPETEDHTESVLLVNTTNTTRVASSFTTVKPTVGNETDVEPEPEPESESTATPEPSSVQTVHNTTLNQTNMTNTTEEPYQNNSVETKQDIPKTTVVTEEPTPEPEQNTASSPKHTSQTSPAVNVSKTSPEPTNNDADTSPEPTSESNPADNGNKTSPELTSNPAPEPTSNPADNGSKTSPEPTSETSPADNGSKTSPEPTSETSPADNGNKTSPEPTPETSPADNGNKTSPEPTSGPGDKGDGGEPEPEDEPESEPEGEEEPEPESEFDAFAEPGPDWVLAKEVWQEAWEFHVYFFGIAFAVLGLYCLITLIRLWDMEHLISKHYFVTLNLLVIIVCILRSVYLLLDAYNSLGTFPVGVDYFMYSTAFPCLTALFSILFYSLLLATRVRVMSNKIQKLWVLLVIVALHFVLSIVTDIVVGFLSNASVLILVCQVFFIVWGLLMFIGYLILFRKLYKGAILHQKTLTGLQHEHKSPVLHGHGYQSKPKHKYTFGLAVKITFISAFFGVAIVGFELYGIFGVYGALNADSKPEPWPWWTYHVIVRILELLMCLSVTFVASQPLRYKLKKKSDHRIYHFLLPCSMCCCPSKIEHINETFSSSGSMDCIVSEPDHLSWLKKIKNKKTPSPQAPYPPHTAEKYSDPDATLLVRKVKRANKPSMLVVEDGFVRIRREDEVMPSNQFELDTYSQSSHSSDLAGVERSNTGAINNVVNLNYTGGQSGPNSVPVHANVPGLNLDSYILQGNIGQSGMPANGDVVDDDTDIDIVVTDESEQESDGAEIPDGAHSGGSNKSADIFRPLSMIDFAASMESELDRAFHSSCVEEIDLISHNSLPMSLEGCSSDSNAFNEPMYNQYFENEGMSSVSFQDSNNYSSDSADSKSSATRLLHSPVRRCKSEDSNSLAPPKCKHFEKNKYFSLSRVDTIAQEDIKYTEL